MMDAQSIINETNLLEEREEENMRMFFPKLYKEKEVDKNITKVCKGEVKRKNE